MHFHRLIALNLVFLTGCSAVIATSGVNLAKLETKDQIHEAFGPPARRTWADSELVEFHRTDRKLSNPKRAGETGFDAVTSLGFSEMLNLPYEFYLLGRDRLIGQEFRVRYNAEGTVRTLFVQSNGDFLYTPDGSWKIGPEVMKNGRIAP